MKNIVYSMLLGKSKKAIKLRMKYLTLNRNVCGVHCARAIETSKEQFT